MTPWLSVVGIGADGLAGLTPAAGALIANAEVLVGGDRHLQAVADVATSAGRLAWRQPLGDTIADIAELRGQRVVVLATGDPMWFGVGATLAGHFAPEEMHVVPAPGAFSLAAARLGWPIAEVACLSVHGRRLDRLRADIAPGARLLILSEDGSTPRRIAALLCEMGYGPSPITVFETMDGENERRIAATAAEWGDRRCADLNTVAVECVAGAGARVLSRVPGLPDDAFVHDGQITKRAVRAATLAALSPLPGQVLWDVGAGCGSIAIEWLRAAPGACAYSIERQPARVDLIARNALALGVPQLHIVTGDALGAFGDLELPDAVFIGGGVAASGLIGACWRALKSGGRLVANAVTVDGEAALIAASGEHGGALSRLAVSVAEPLGAHLAWRALRPVTQWQAMKV